MNLLLDEIKELVSEHPKHFSQMIRRKPELIEYIDSFGFTGDNLSEKIYRIINQLSPSCDRGNNRRFISMSAGYGYCGVTSKCQCLRENVSEKVTAQKALLTEEDHLRINAKRVSTNIEKYGVDNTGKLAVAKENHSLIYSDSVVSQALVDKVRVTKLARYGDPSYNNKEKTRNTVLEKHGVTSSLLLSADNNNPNLAILRDKTLLSDLYMKMNIPELADGLGVHIQTVYRYLNQHNLRQPFVSSEEEEVCRFLADNGVTNVVRNSRSILPSGKELDIYLPDYKVAIEYNGVYWHHEDVAHITKSYHYDKFKECESLGIQLITVFSSVWKSRKDVVKKTLLSKISHNGSSVYARKCVVVEVSTAVARKMLDENHVQGYTPAMVKLGLEYNGEVVAVMCFSKGRVGIGKKRGENSWELVRFVSSVRVIGGASKLIKAFVDCNVVDEIVSYSDNEWSDGSLYKVLGFSLEKEHGAGYWYVKPREEKMYHRYVFAKHKLVEMGYSAEMSGNEITRKMGLLKVWDCGKRTWVMKINNGA